MTFPSEAWSPRPLPSRRWTPAVPTRPENTPPCFPTLTCALLAPCSRRLGGQFTPRIRRRASNFARRGKNCGGFDSGPRRARALAPRRRVGGEAVDAVEKVFEPVVRLHERHLHAKFVRA